MFKYKSNWILAAVLVAASLHSIVLGLVMLLAPHWFLNLMEWPHEGGLFFPSQSGIFLIILGLGYLASVKYVQFYYFTLMSKALAVAFLFTHWLFLNAPASVKYAGAVDAFWLLILVGSLPLVRKRTFNVLEKGRVSQVAAFK